MPTSTNNPAAERALSSAMRLNNRGVNHLNKSNDLSTATQFFHAALKQVKRSVLASRKQDPMSVKQRPSADAPPSVLRNPNRDQQQEPQGLELRTTSTSPLASSTETPTRSYNDNNHHQELRSARPQNAPASSVLLSPAAPVAGRTTPQAPGNESVVGASSSFWAGSLSHLRVCAAPVKLLAQQGDVRLASSNEEQICTVEAGPRTILLPGDRGYVRELRKRARTASMVITFNLALTHHLSCSEDQEALATHQKQALELYEIADHLLCNKNRRVPARNHGLALSMQTSTGLIPESTSRGTMEPSTTPASHTASDYLSKISQHHVPLQLSILNNMAVLYLQTDNVDRAKLHLQRLSLRLESTTVVLNDTTMKDFAENVQILKSLLHLTECEPAAAA